MTRIAMTGKKGAIQQVHIKDNWIGADGREALIHVSDQTDLRAAMSEALKATIYVSPALVSVCDAAILTGRYKKLWEAYHRRLEARRAFMEALWGLVRYGRVRAFAGASVELWRAR